MPYYSTGVNGLGQSIDEAEKMWGSVTLDGKKYVMTDATTIDGAYNASPQNIRYSAPAVRVEDGEYEFFEIRYRIKDGIDFEDEETVPEDESEMCDWTKFEIYDEGGGEVGCK